MLLLDNHSDVYSKALLIVTLKLEGVNSAGFNDSTTVISPLLLRLLVSEVLPPHLPKNLLRLKAIPPLPEGAVVGIVPRSLPGIMLKKSTFQG